MEMIVYTSSRAVKGGLADNKDIAILNDTCILKKQLNQANKGIRSVVTLCCFRPSSRDSSMYLCRENEGLRACDGNDW